MHLKMGVVIMFGAARAKTEVSVDQAMGLRQKFGSGSGVWLDWLVPVFAMGLSITRRNRL